MILRHQNHGPEAIIEEVHKHCTEDTVVATDVGQHPDVDDAVLPFEKPHTLLTSGSLGTMGYGFGAAIGGCIAARAEEPFSSPETEASE